MTAEHEQPNDPVEAAEPAQVAVYSCGPSTATCQCECSRGGPCEHVWDGAGIEVEYENGGSMSSASCSKCEMLAIDHDMWLF